MKTTRTSMTKKVTKINIGVYALEYKGRRFEIEDISRASDGDVLPGWMAFEIHGLARAYINDRSTKRAAIQCVIDAVDEGY